MLACSLLSRSLSNFQVIRTGIRSQTSSNSGLIRLVTGVICLWLLKKAIDDIVQGVVLSFFIGSLWNLQITWAGIKSHVFKIWPEWTIYFEVTCLDCWKDHIWPSGHIGEQSLPFGWLVWLALLGTWHIVFILQWISENGIHTLLAHVSHEPKTHKLSWDIIASLREDVHSFKLKYLRGQWSNQSRILASMTRDRTFNCIPGNHQVCIFPVNQPDSLLHDWARP